jgi:Tfp pilus assembly protein PilF
MQRLNARRVINRVSAPLAASLLLALLLAPEGPGSPATMLQADALYAAVSQDNASPPDLLDKARQAEQLHDFQTAAGFYRDYLKTHAEDAAIFQRLGLVEYLSNRFDAAIPALSKALQLDSSLWGSALYLGMSYYRMDRFQEAVPVLKRALTLKPDVPETGYWLACSLLADHEPETAIPYLLAVQHDSTWGAQAQSMLIRAYREAAEQSYQRIATVAPDSDRVHLVKARLLQWKGINNDAVWEARQALQRNPSLEGAHRIVGEVYWQEKGFDLAAQEFQAELHVNPLDGESNLRLGEFSLAKGEAGQAMAYLRTALAENAGSPGETHHFLGEAALAGHDYAAALTNLESAVEENPGDAANHQLLAEVYRATGRIDQAATEERLAGALPRRPE